MKPEDMINEFFEMNETTKTLVMDNLSYFRNNVEDVQSTELRKNELLLKGKLKDNKDITLTYILTNMIEPPYITTNEINASLNESGISEGVIQFERDHMNLKTSFRWGVAEATEQDVKNLVNRMESELYKEIKNKGFNSFEYQQL